MIARSSSDSETIAAAAAYWARRGRWVFPCVPFAKRPTTQAGFKDASRDPAKATQWWESIPNANLGMPTGVANGFFVLDVDVDAEREIDGREVLRDLERANEGLPQTYTVKTPRGGSHYYFQFPDFDLRNRTDFPGKGIDVRGEGGYVVAPPSRTEQGEYCVDSEAEIAPAPEWLLNLLREPITRRTNPAETNETSSTDAEKKEVSESEIREALAKIAPENYDIWLKVGMALHHWDAIDGFRLWDEWSRRCPEKYGEDVTREKWRSFNPRCANPIKLATVFALATESTVQPVDLEDWPDAVPFEPRSSTECMPWPWERFPKQIRDMGIATARTLGVSENFVGMAMLSLCSIGLGNRALGFIKGDHSFFPNLYCMVIAQPGQKKTPVSKILEKPFLEWQKQRAEAFARLHIDWVIQKERAEKDIQKAEKDLLCAQNETERKRLIGEIRRNQELLNNEPKAPVLWTNDATSESLARRMSENHGFVGVFSSEGRKILQIANGRYTGNRADLGLWLAAYSADYYRKDRESKDRSSFEIEEPLISALIMTQPDTLRTLGLNEEMRESGFLARWEFCLPEPADIRYREDAVESEIVSAYEALVFKLLNANRLALAVEPTKQKPISVWMTPEAKARWIAIHDALMENEYRDAMDASATDFANYIAKVPERIARIALIFAMLRCIEADDLATPWIEEEDVEAAEAVSRILRTDAQRAYGFMGESAERVTTRRLWEALNKNREKIVTWREGEGLPGLVAVKPKDISKARWAGIGDVQEAKEYLRNLERLGYLKKQTIDSRGRRNHEVYHLRPD